MMDPIVDIIIDGALYASRTWTIIPRVGEIVIFNDAKVQAKVTDVVWGDDTRAPRGARQWVQVACVTFKG